MRLLAGELHLLSKPRLCLVYRPITKEIFELDGKLNVHVSMTVGPALEWLALNRYFGKFGASFYKLFHYARPSETEGRGLASK